MFCFSKMKYADVAGSGLLCAHVLHLVNKLHNGKRWFQCSLRRVTWLVLFEGVKWVNPCRFAVAVSVGQKTKTKKRKKTKSRQRKKKFLAYVHSVRSSIKFRLQHEVCLFQSFSVHHRQTWTDLKNYLMSFTLEAMVCSGCIFMSIERTWISSFWRRRVPAQEDPERRCVRPFDSNNKHTRR